MTTDLGRNVQTLSVGDAIDQVTCVVVQYGVDANGNPLTKTATASPNNGRTINITVSHIAEAMAQTVANNILAQYSNIVYSSLTATNAELDPACELFDKVSVNNIPTAIGAVDTNFNKAMYADIEAQGIPEDEEFPFTSLIERQVQRADTKADTAIAGLADKASKTEAQGYADTAEQNAETAAQGYANTAEQNAKTYASQQASAAQTAAEAAAAIDASTKAQAARTNAKADVDAALAAGTTTISGNCITTGTVNANLITTGTMAADRISGGSLVLGGTDNVNGQLYIQDANNANIGTWNNAGIVIRDSSPTQSLGTPKFKLRKLGSSTNDYGVDLGVWCPTIMGDDPAIGYLHLTGTYDGSEQIGDVQLSSTGLRIRRKEGAIGALTWKEVNIDVNSLGGATPTGSVYGDTQYGGRVVSSSSSHWGKMNELTLVLGWWTNFTMPNDTNIYTGTITTNLPASTVYATAHQVDSTFKAWIDTSGNVVIRNSTSKTVYGTTAEPYDWSYLTVTFTYLEA